MWQNIEQLIANINKVNSGALETFCKLFNKKQPTYYNMLHVVTALNKHKRIFRLAGNEQVRGVFRGSSSP